MAREDDGWVSVVDAANRLGLARWYVAAGRRTGRFPVVRRQGTDWMRAADLDALVDKRDAERSRYVSYEAAAQMAACSHVAVERAVTAGEIAQRPGERHRGQPSLVAESARAWAAGWRERQDARATEQAARQAATAEKQHLNRPPDDGHVWLDAKTAAIAVGVTVGGLRTMALQDRVPHERVGRRVWFRLDLLEIWLAARSAAPRFRTGL